MNNIRYTIFYCKDCDSDFLKKATKTKSPYCPECGENIYTEKIKTIWNNGHFYKYNRTYTEEEDEILTTARAAGVPFKQIAEELLQGRTYRALESRAKVLGITKGNKRGAAN
jgi:predicted RNA-binding Zn-ribbon protein involved in translation (DUF1610 family)